MAAALVALLVGLAVAFVYGGAATFEVARADRASAEAARVEAYTARDREANLHRETMAVEANAHREALVAMALGGRSASENWLSAIIGGLAGVAVGAFIVRRWLWFDRWPAE